MFHVEWQFWYLCSDSGWVMTQICIYNYVSTGGWMYASRMAVKTSRDPVTIVFTSSCLFALNLMHCLVYLILSVFSSLWIWCIVWHHVCIYCQFVGEFGAQVCLLCHVWLTLTSLPPITEVIYSPLHQVNLFLAKELESLPSPITSEQTVQKDH